MSKIQSFAVRICKKNCCLEAFMAEFLPSKRLEKQDLFMSPSRSHRQSTTVVDAKGDPRVE